MDAGSGNGDRQRSRIDSTWTPLVAFVAAYCGAIALAFAIHPPETTSGAQLTGLIAVVFATIAAARLAEGRIGDPALFTRPGNVLLALAAGIAIGTAAVVAGHFAAVASSGLLVKRGPGVPWGALALTILPAVLHEELLFRGYAFQKLLAWRPSAAILTSSLIFAALHGGNRHVGPIALVNIALAGVLLALTFLLFRSLWAPIGAHLAWNVVSGPILGHEVSGWDAPATLFETLDPGPAWITGGEFGIEGSVWMTLVQIAGIAALAWRIRNGPGFGPVDTIRHWKLERKPA